MAFHIVQANEIFCCEDGLSDQHRQTVAGGNAAAFGIEQKTAAMRVVDDIEAGFKLRKTVELDESCAIVWIHANRSGIDDDLGIVMQSDVAVRHGIVATEDDDLAGAFVAKHGGDGFGSGAVTEDEAFAAVDGDTGVVQGKGQAIVIGVGAEKSAVGATDDGVDTADALRFLVDVVAERHHRFLVRNGDIDALPVTAFKKGGDVHRFHFKKLIVVVANLRMNLW